MKIRQMAEGLIAWFDVELFHRLLAMKIKKTTQMLLDWFTDKGTDFISVP